MATVKHFLKQNGKTACGLIDLPPGRLKPADEVTCIPCRAHLMPRVISVTKLKKREADDRARTKREERFARKYGKVMLG